MSLVKIEGNASGTGTFTIAAPNSNTNRTLTLPDATGTIITTAGGAAISGTTGTFSGTISGGSTVGVGGATPSASGAGITFPATQSASTNANTLDDYEEGNFTPTLAEGSSSTTYTTQGGFYIKIGRMVYINLQLDCATTSASGSIIGIGGLPFTCGNTNNTGWCAISSGFNSSFNTNTGDSYVVYPTTAIVRVYANDGNYRSPSAGGINLNGSICLSGCYYID